MLRGIAAALLFPGALASAFAAPAGKALVYRTERSPAGFDPGQHTTGTDSMMRPAADEQRFELCLSRDGR